MTATILPPRDFDTSVNLPWAGPGKVAATPIAFVKLYCGCYPVYDHHNVEVDQMAICPEPDVCTGHDGLGITAVEGVIKTEVVG